ncbi:conjugal transfer protein MobB [Mucilaginibacter koreensis]
MVAKIRSGKSLKGALSYNEVKVATGRAELLAAIGYSMDPEELSFRDKLFRLTDLAGRNQRVRTNTVHISLNFDISEHLTKGTLSAIAERYMTGIGFGTQPYLVYQHFDAGHPHVHILTTNIDRDGHRISLHNLGKTRSEDARKAIEFEFGLRKAESKCQAEAPRIEPVLYGEGASKLAVEQVVRVVADTYRFTSLPEFNAVLQHYNIMADRGNTTSVMYKNNGLRYWILDNSGQKIGTPLKASELRGKPTLKLLGQRFLLNDALRRAVKEQIRSKVDAAIRENATLKGFQRSLQKADIRTIIRRTDTGVIYGLTFVDHHLKVVFNGSDLGKSYAAAAIASRFAGDRHAPDLQLRSSADRKETLIIGDGNDSSELLTALFGKTSDEPGIPAAHRTKKKKKKRLNL